MKVWKLLSPKEFDLLLAFWGTCFIDREAISGQMFLDL
jgi:hypothetical protein